MLPPPPLNPCPPPPHTHTLRVPLTAAGLRIFSAHSSIKNAGVRIEDADVVLNTKDSQVPPLLKHKPIHRLIIDESHQLPRPGGHTQHTLLGYHARCIWLCTGTPLSRSVDDLKAGAMLLGHVRGNGQDLFLERAPLVHCESLGSTLVAKLRRLMIRHSKSQRIGGEVALALPESDTSTVWLDFSVHERRLYEQAVAHESNKMEHALQDGAAAMTLEMTVAKRRAACGNAYCKNKDGRSVFHEGGPFSKEDVESMCTSKQIQRGVEYSSMEKRTVPHFEQIHTSIPERCTKLAALRKDLVTLRQEDPSMHAVVFTHLVVSHRNIVEMLHAAGFVVCEFSGTTGASKRHDAIREFQESGQKQDRVAKVFVVTIKTGSAGITLTAASRVYLMEPCFDPGDGCPAV